MKNCWRTLDIAPRRHVWRATASRGSWNYRRWPLRHPLESIRYQMPIFPFSAVTAGASAWTVLVLPAPYQPFTDCGGTPLCSCLAALFL